MDDRPLAIIDSGLGGLSIAQAIWQLLPKESTLYLADHAYFPYGNKTSQQLNRRLLRLFRFLQLQNVKLVVIACNTITVTSINFLRTFFHFPIVGTVPALKPAIKANLKDNIVVLVTPKTASSQYLKNMVKEFDKKGRVISHPCPGLAEAVEKYLTNPFKLKQIIKSHLQKITLPYQTLVLGSTHYILAMPLIKSLVPSTVRLIEPKEAIAQQTQRLLEEHSLLVGPKHLPKRIFLTSGDPAQASRTASYFLKQSIIFTACDF
jgi:glutamate racemase